MTLATYRSRAQGRREPSELRPHGGFLADALSAKPTGRPLEVDVYGRASHRPPWLAGEYLARLEAQGRGVGVIYLLYFDRATGDLANRAGSLATTRAGPTTCRPVSPPMPPAAGPGSGSRRRGGDRLAAGLSWNPAPAAGNGGSSDPGRGPPLPGCS